MTYKQSLEFELEDLQCLRLCIANGFTIQDWLETKENLVAHYEYMAKDSALDKLRSEN